MLKKKMISLTAAVLLAASLSLLCFSSSQVWAKDYECLVVMSDVHYGSKEHKDLAKRARVMANKEKAVQDINSWKDVDLCIFTGDLEIWWSFPPGITSTVWPGSLRTK